jgi:hypothetical protein
MEACVFEGGGEHVADAFGDVVEQARHAAAASGYG